MRKTLRLAMGAAVLAALSGFAVATNYTLWINGRSNSATPGNHADFRYWGPATTAAGVNKKSVNWDGYNSIANTNGKVRDALAGRDDRWLQAINHDPTGSWPDEPGFLVADAELLWLHDLAARFYQNAFVAARLGEAPRLVWLV